MLLLLVIAALALVLVGEEAFLAKRYPVPTRRDERPLGPMTPKLPR